jgi:hypothetical protein
MIAQWIKDCQENHPSCNKKSHDGIPSRLLRISAFEDPENEYGEPRIELHLEDTDPNEKYQYVAVSHCWEVSNPLKTTAENFPQHTNQVPWDQMSSTFREAIIITTALGFEYIWIDSCCIIQQDRADWEKESPRMGMIYSNAVVVFALLGPTLGIEKSSTDGITDQLHHDDAMIYCRPKIDHSVLSYSPINQSNNSWFARAWCMQERILGSRILYFGGTYEELMFECNTDTLCECGRIDATTLKVRFAKSLSNAIGDDGNVSKEALWRIYVELCENYTARHLTVSADKLPAISSYMKLFSTYFGQYYAGLWEYNLLLSLQWEALDTAKCSREEAYIAPSFSWASQTGPVVWYHNTENLPSAETYNFSEIIEVSCTAETDLFGVVTQGHLKLQGWITEMIINSKDWHEPDGRLKMEKEGSESCYVTLDSVQDWERVQSGSIVTCFDVMRDKDGEFVSGLVLLPVENKVGYYQRIGFSTMKKLHFEEMTWKEIVII